MLSRMMYPIAVTTQPAINETEPVLHFVACMATTSVQTVAKMKMGIEMI
jgi:hypothetical protein